MATGKRKQSRLLLEVPIAIVAIPVKVTRTPKGTMHSDRASLTSCIYKDESCPTTDGGLTTWTARDTLSTTKVVWTGSAQVSEGIIIINELQEAYNLIGPIKVGKMETQHIIQLVFMADKQAADTVAHCVKAEPRRAYLGKSENQHNSRAPNAWRASAQPSADKLRPLSVKDPPQEFPPATKRHDTSTVKMTEANPGHCSLFANGTSMRESVPRLTFTPSTITAIEMSHQT